MPLPGRPAEQLSGGAQVQRVYLVEVTDMDSYSLNLETVFMLDRATRKLSRCAVKRAPGVTEDSDNVLRITCACCLLSFFSATSCSLSHHDEGNCHDMCRAAYNIYALHQCLAFLLIQLFSCSYEQFW